MNKNTGFAPLVLVIIAAVVLGGGIFTITGLVEATVGGPTYIYDFRYNPANESVYYVSASQSGRGCPPVLKKLSLASGASQTVFSCEQGEAILAKSAPAPWYPAPLMAEFERITERFERLIPVHLSKSDIAIDLDFVRTENYSPDIEEVKLTQFVADVYQSGRSISEFQVGGCSKEQPFVFAGYAIPSVPDTLVLVSSAKSDCFEGGYIGESLHVIRGISGLEMAGPTGFYKGNEPLIPSEATLVVFEKDKVVKNGGDTKNESADNSSREKQDGLSDGYGESAAFVLVAALFTMLGVVLGRTVFRKKEALESERNINSPSV